MKIGPFAKVIVKIEVAYFFLRHGVLSARHAVTDCSIHVHPKQCLIS